MLQNNAIYLVRKMVRRCVETVCHIHRPYGLALPDLKSIPPAHKNSIPGVHSKKLFSKSQAKNQMKPA
jgi:hypothetical protein